MTVARRLALFLCSLMLLSAGAAWGFQIRQQPSRFDRLIVHDPSATAGVATLPVGSLPASDPSRAGWEGFKAVHGPGWSIYLDRRSGAPLIVQGQGIPWIAGTGNKLLDPAPPDLGSLDQQWCLLIFEFWLYALRNPSSGERLAAVYRQFRADLAPLLAPYTGASMEPEERVRVATAPSTVTTYSSERPPFMLKPPLLTLSGSKVPIAPPCTPGFKSAR